MSEHHGCAATEALQAKLASALEHHRAGGLNEAEWIYRQILAADSRNADSLHLLGMVEQQRGNYDAARDLIREAIAVDGRQAHYHLNLGTVLETQGKLEEAEQCYRLALRLNGDLAEAHINLGNVREKQGQSGEAEECYKRALAIKPALAEGWCHLGNLRYGRGEAGDAIRCLERALALKPDYADAHNNLGIALAKADRTLEAIVHYQRAIELQPLHANAHNNLGLALVAQGRLDEAVRHYSRALELIPGDATVNGNLGMALAAQGRVPEAVAHYERALELDPNYANAHSNLGMAFAAQGRTVEAISHYEQALAIDPNHAAAHNNLGIVLADQDKAEEAISHYAQAFVIDPNCAEALNNLGNVLKAQGRFKDALDYYGRAVAIRPDYAEAHLHRAELRFFRPEDPELAALEALAASETKVPEAKAPHLHFALAKALEDVQDYPRAFEHLRIGNSLKRSQIEYNEAATLDLFHRIVTVFDRGLLERRSASGDPSSVPVFVLGMPRSGSTLVEQILASHPQIHAAGELEYLEKAIHQLSAGDPPAAFPECVRALDHIGLRQLAQAYLASLPAAAKGASRIVDKLTGNFLNIGLIRMMLPNARIIHTMRDPVDTCMSCYSRLFTGGLPFTYDLAELGRYYRGYQKLMAHWRAVLPPGGMLEVSYENVVHDLEGEARRLISYCGLPWDGRCLFFHQTKRLVKTASAVRVRQPLTGESIGRWQKYEAGLDPLLIELGMKPGTAG